MPHPVKLSDQLVADARVVADLSERSIASQIEYWAALGRVVDRLLGAEKVLQLKQRGDIGPSWVEVLRSVDTPEGRARTRRYLEAGPYPHFEAAPDRPGYLVKIDEDGTRTVGRILNRKFVPAE